MAHGYLPSVSNNLAEYGLTVTKMEGDRDIRKVEGIISRDKVGDLWKLKGVECIMEQRITSDIRKETIRRNREALGYFPKYHVDLEVDVWENEGGSLGHMV